ncbi:MAG: N-acetylmuramoyl-L-alanine amidase [Candidatus Omnitrophica bacterium]|nr:N-acetylmuramoyl-L-alanine amidase [Candidatus Omnitrophota bacterium]
MKNLKPVLVYLLLAVFLCGCATTSGVSAPRLKRAVTIDGTPYIPAPSLCESYNIDYVWDAFSKKIILQKDSKEVRIMANSSIALLDDTVRIMDKEAKVYQKTLAIPQSFVRKALVPFFREEPVSRRALPAKGAGPIKTVIIDPGHGGKDPGAIGRGGLKEKDVVLDIAKRLKKKLKGAGIDVVLTRESDKFISLDERRRITNTNAKNGDFFISIHANASRSKWVNGIEVFYLSESIDDNQRSFKAAKDYKLNLKERYSGKDTERILWDLIYSDDRKSSASMADFICCSLSKNLSQRNRGKKEGRLYVLKTNIPAVLVEAGFISNAWEEKKLKTSSYREKIAQAIADGIIQYNQSTGQKYYTRY